METKLLERISLKGRLLLFLVPPLTLLLCISAVLDFRLAHRTIDSAYDSTLTDVVTDLESLVRFSGGDNSGKLDLSPEVANLIESDLPDKIFFCVRDDKGNVLAGDADVPAFSRQLRSIHFEDSVWHKHEVRIASHTTKILGREIQVTVLKTTLSRNEAMRSFLSAMIGPNLVFILLTLVCVWIAVKNGLGPLEQLESEIADRKANDLSEIKSTGYPPEIKPLLNKLNELLRILSKSQLSQQRFLADAAHQLRTPLASLQTNIEIFLKNNQDSEDTHLLSNALMSSDRMAHLISQLLAYARSENGESFGAPRQEINFCLLLEKAASSVIDAAIEKNIDLSFDLQPVSAIGIDWMLFEAVINLVDNAIRYTPTGGNIHVRCYTEKGHPTLEVLDSGPGIPEIHQTEVFDRFFRLPRETSSGCGLGLSIVQQICETHAANIKLFNRPEGGLSAKITFPSS